MEPTCAPSSPREASGATLSKGQQAIALAILFPEAEKGGRGKKSSTNLADAATFSQRRLQEARSVLAFSRELAEAVREGPISLDDALKRVEAARTAQGSAEGMRERLAAEAPDLLDLVDEDRMKLGETGTMPLRPCTTAPLRHRTTIRG